MTADSQFAQLDALVAEAHALAKKLKAEITDLGPYERKAVGYVVRYLSATRHNTTYLRDMT